ncbi:MAG: adenylyltransferase/cytidyltransferase family protein [Candidatus Sumerlaeota bacterium]|nr:adenylyltransferase/cytidyltransferase family protein [Candidatus Sumerlaeota bacterium]
MDRPSPVPRDPKIKSPEEMEVLCRQLHAQGKKIVQCSGCFILTHIGHVQHLKFAKSIADVLIVSTNTDASLARVRRDKNAFYVNQEDRAEMLAAIAVVDYVTFFDETAADHLALKLRPDFFVKGSDYGETDVLEKRAVESYGGKVIISPTPKLWASTLFVKMMTEDQL